MPELSPSMPLEIDKETDSLDGIESWQHVLKSAVRTPDELCKRLGLPESVARRGETAARSFPVFAPEPYLSRIRPGDPADPLLRQILPLKLEDGHVPGFVADPLDEASFARQRGLLSKYPGRALMVTTSVCAVHCRYCFRRHYSYGDVPRTISDWQPAFDEIAADPTIREIILSGGDPLTLRDSLLQALIDQLAGIFHLCRLRVHTRLPIMIPQRITSELVRILRGSRLTTIMVVHANHPAEIDDHVIVALSLLAEAGVPVLNQAVLLAGVNDDADVLAELSERLIGARVMPYYLHQLDPVEGAAHFEVPVTRGKQLMDELRKRLPGYGVPRYVREVPGLAHKAALD